MAVLVVLLASLCWDQISVVPVRDPDDKVRVDPYLHLRTGGVFTADSEVEIASVSLDHFRSFVECMGGPKLKTYIQPKLCYPCGVLEPGDGTVQDRAKELVLGCPVGLLYCAHYFDFDRDGDVDLADLAEIQKGGV